MDPAPLPSSPHPERQAKNEGFKKLAVHLSSVADTRLAILFTPAADSTAGQTSPSEVIPLDKW